MSVTERPTVLPLNNDWAITVEDAQRFGDVQSALSLRGYLAELRDDPVAIDPTLTVTLDPWPSRPGDYRGTISGDDITTILGPMLGETVWVVAESVPPGAYRDAFPVTIVADQSG
jgi:hypothetical protein